MSSPGEQIRAARKSRGWSQTRLAREAGVSLRTITRIETAADYDDPRTIPQVQRALDLGEYAPAHDYDGPPLRTASAAELAAEMVRRVTEAQRVLDHSRIRAGELPDDVFDQPDVRTSRPRRHPDQHTGDDG